MRTRQHALTPNQRAILEAVERGHTDLRDICEHTGISSTSVVSYNLKQLAAKGHIVLEGESKRTRIADGRDFCAGWDAAARLAGNPDA